MRNDMVTRGPTIPSEIGNSNIFNNDNTSQYERSGGNNNGVATTTTLQLFHLRIHQ